MSEQESPTLEADDTAEKQTNKGIKIVLILIIASLVLYLFGDRYTPMTSQARVEGYVIGVAPNVAGRVIHVWINNNQKVKKGQRLFEIDPDQYKIALSNAEANLDNTRRQVSAGQANVTAVKAQVISTQAQALKNRREAERLERLYKEDPGTVSLKRVESAQASYQSSVAKVAAKQAQVQAAIEQMGGEDLSTNTLILSAKTAVDKAKLDLSHTIVTAKTDGMITDLQADVGQYAGTGSPVLTLLPIHDVWVSANYTENNLTLMHAGDEASLVFDSLPGHIFTGYIESIGSGVSDGTATSAGVLPTIDNNRDWLRQSQRFPVIIRFNTTQKKLNGQIRIGGQVTSIVYNNKNGLILNWLGAIYIRITSWLSYAY